jgi:NADPH:quinone reductase-like Zn-dependent oxidoreductase
MKAWQVQQLGDPEQALRLEEVEEPEPGRGEVVVEVCEGFGAEVAIDYRQENFVEVVKEATEGRGADVIFDPDGSRRCVAFEGRIVVVGFAGGRIAEARQTTCW